MDAGAREAQEQLRKCELILYRLVVIFLRQLRFNKTSTGILTICNAADQPQLCNYPLLPTDKNAPAKKLLDLPKYLNVRFISSSGTKVLLDKSTPPSGDIMKIVYSE